MSPDLTSVFSLRSQLSNSTSCPHVNTLAAFTHALNSGELPRFSFSFKNPGCVVRVRKNQYVRTSGLVHYNSPLISLI